MSIREKAVKGVVWSAIQNWGSQAGSLVIFMLLARLLPPEAFGLVAFANVFLAFMQIFLNQGFAQVVIQRQELEPEHIDTAFWTNIAIGICLTVICFSTAGIVANLWQKPELTSILQGFSLLFLISSLSNIQQAILERNLHFKAIAIRSLAGTFIGGIVGVILALYNFSIWSLIGQQLVQELIGTIVLWNRSDWRPGFKFSLKHFQELFSFGVNILGFNFLTFINTRADDFLIGYFLGATALGYYVIAYRILGVMTQLLISTTNQVALPVFSQLQTQAEEFRKVFFTATQLSTLIAFPAFLGVATLAPELIVLLFGKQWVPSIPVMQVLSFAGLFKCINFFKNSVFIALGKPSWSLYFGLLNALLNLIGFVVAVPWGIVAVALAYVIRGYLVFPISQWAVSKLIKIPLLVYLGHFIVPLFSSLIMVVSILAAKHIFSNSLNLHLLLAIYIFISIIVYGLTIRIFSPKLFRKLLSFIRLATSH